MFNNDSTSSLTSLSDERPERKRHQGWRKPVPQYVPDPPKKPSLLANTSALRRMALLTSGDEQPPLPANWRENIEKALGYETLDVERPGSPTPESVSSLEQASSSNHGVTKTRANLASSKLRVEKALPKVPCLEANLQSDCGSTLAGSTRSMKLETSERPSVRSAHSRTRSLPSAQIKEQSTPPPLPAFHITRRGEDPTGLYGAYNAPYCIVYPRGLGTNSIDTTRRHVAVFPVFSGSTTDLSVNATVVDSREDVRSTCNLRNSSSIPSILKPGASPVLRADEKCKSIDTLVGQRPSGLCQRVKHAFRGCLCLAATTHKY
ncbi:hypothetical protein PsYK624_002910 [Phanerochaete sordida]|uniref:Uncharacterized protein n=1 Tax=Phanerochaete sordida TaxID=48140 RepID=A0A9P3FXL1_9APHY|nr:hypothetical protein PsYK624_002910 [Phanerochaete sordida]